MSAATEKVPNADCGFNPPPPPPVPPPARSSVNLPKPVASPVDIHQEASKITTDPRLTRYFPEASELEIRVAARGKAFLPRIQDGPVCGLVALQMSADLAGVDSGSDVEALIRVGREMGITSMGEMYSANGLARLGCWAWPELSCTVAPIEDRRQLLRHLAGGNTCLVPYDTSPNHSPGLSRGHNAHWAVVVGTAAAAAAESAKSDPDAHGGGLLLFAFHGKSARLQAWRYADVLASNRNLAEEGERRRGNVVLPEGSVGAGLAGKVVLVARAGNGGG